MDAKLRTLLERIDKYWRGDLDSDDTSETLHAEIGKALAQPHGQELDRPAQKGKSKKAEDAKSDSE